MTDETYDEQEMETEEAIEAMINDMAENKKENENERYYLIETEGSREGFILFWVWEAHGYTIDLEQAGLFNYDFVKEHYLGQSKDTIAVKESEFKRLSKTYKIVWNHHEILNNLEEKHGRK